MSLYKVTVLRNNDKLLPYIITVESDNEDNAAMIAKRFVAKNGWFPSYLTIEEIINSLTIYEIVTLHTGDTVTC